MRIIKYLGIILIVAGTLMVMWPLGQYVYATYWQNRMLQEWEVERPSEPIARDPGLEESPLIDTSRHHYVPPDPKEEAFEDEGPFLIEIPSLNVRAVVVDGVEPEHLALGPGFYPDRPLPGQDGNVSVAGHRTTYGAWFRRVDELVPGDIILFESPLAIYAYEVEDVFVVARNAWEVVGPTEQPSLTITTCHPPGSDRERLVVRARYIDFTLRTNGDENL